MKQILCHSLFLFFLLFLFYSSRLYARPLTSKQGQADVNINKMSCEDSLMQTESSSSELISLIGFEACERGDEECFKRRILSDAHLDYIYTQDQKP